MMTDVPCGCHLKICGALWTYGCGMSELQRKAMITQKWQDELRYKFEQTYLIYGRDFFVTEPAHWKIHEHVIVSVDLAKRDDHLALFLQAGGWDVVIFDEGHKLTRYASGERAQRY